MRSKARERKGQESLEDQEVNPPYERGQASEDGRMRVGMMKRC